MPIIQPPFINNDYYHLYNRGVAKQNIYLDKNDYYRFLKVIAYYLDSQINVKYSFVPQTELKDIIETPTNKPLVKIVSYCLMPNHFHLLVQQLLDAGISEFMRKSLNSYTRYFNTKRDRVGTIFQGTYRAVRISADEQLLHTSRYIHLNPFSARLCNNPREYQWSSLKALSNDQPSRISNPKIILDLIKTTSNYLEFIDDYADYSRSLSDNKKLFLDQR